MPKPIYKLRKLNWTKIPKPKITGTLWEPFRVCDKDTWDSLLDVPTLLEYFQLDDDKAAHKLAPIVQKKNIIDLRRAQQIALLVNILKMTPSEIKNGILRFEEKAFTLDQLKSLIKLLPTEEEKTQLKTFKDSNPNEINLLGEAERFFLEIMDVPKLGEKIQMQIAWKSFLTNGSRIKDDMNRITIGVNELRASKKLPGILEVVLWIGNFLNYGSAIGQAAGFTVDSLMKLGDSRSSKLPTYTVLTYLTWFIVKKKPDLVSFSDELASVRNAALDNYNAIIGETKELETAYQLLESQVEQGGDIAAKLREIQTVMKTDLDEMNARKNGMENAYNEMLRIYAHDRSIDVATVISNFTKLFDASLRQFLKKEEEEAQKADDRKISRVKAEKGEFSTLTSRKKKVNNFGRPNVPPSLPSTGPVAPELPDDDDDD